MKGAKSTSQSQSQTMNIYNKSKSNKKNQTPLSSRKTHFKQQSLFFNNYIQDHEYQKTKMKYSNLQKELMKKKKKSSIEKQNIHHLPCPIISWIKGLVALGDKFCVSAAKLVLVDEL